MIVKQAANVVELLEYFATRQAPATMPEIARDLGWPRSSTFNLIETLAARGYLYEPKARSGYYPTPLWMDVAGRVAAGEPLPAAVEALIADVAGATGETTAIVAPAGTSAVFLRVAESRFPIRYFAKVGHRVPIHASSSGRALLAQFDAAEREALYRRIDFPRFPNAPADAAAVERKLAAEQALGYHMSDGEFSPDLVGVAAPLWLPARRLAISVAGPRFRCFERIGWTADVLRDAIDRRAA